MDELQKLQGVGRKTANVVASVLYDIPTMPVDTHVFRVSERVGLTQNAKIHCSLKTAGKVFS